MHGALGASLLSGDMCKGLLQSTMSFFDVIGFVSMTSPFHIIGCGFLNSSLATINFFFFFWSLHLDFNA
jgi:hypothetical protein